MTAELENGQFEIGAFLTQEREKDLLRFSTAGSVDDGKSTLIGRLLYDTQSVYEDQVKSIEGKGTTAPGQLDFALLTDGLRAEREQGITIDVAYRYFATARRKFIIADTPGHEQYTRNMATGASTADAAVVLIDASKGVLVQSRRHAYIASLLRVRHVLVAVNKMDLIGYDEGAFRTIEEDFRAVLAQIAADTGNPVEAQFIPVSALKGDNIVHRAKDHSGAMAWYAGPSLLELLENLPAAAADRGVEQFRFPVQRVVRPDRTFRGFAGQIASGTVRVGDRITALPSGRSAEIARIVTWDGDLAEARAPLSVTLVLNQELDISRGDLIAAAEQPATVAKSARAALVWMDRRPLELHRRYLLKHTSQTVPAFVTAIDHKTSVTTLTHEPAAQLEMNEIGVVELHLLRPIALDVYGVNRATGAFILIDAETNSTVAAGMVTAAPGDTAGGEPVQQVQPLDPVEWGPVTAAEREARWGHRGGVLELSGPAELIDAVERSLFVVGAVTVRVAGASAEAAKLLRDAGVLALVVQPDESGALTIESEGHRITLDTDESKKAVAAAHQLLRDAEIFAAAERADI